MNISGTDAPPSADYCMRNATPTNLTAGQGAYFTKDTASTTVTESDLKVICVIYTAPPGTKFVVTPILINLDRNSLIINGKQSWRSDGKIMFIRSEPILVFLDFFSGFPLDTPILFHLFLCHILTLLFHTHLRVKTWP